MNSPKSSFLGLSPPSPPNNTATRRSPRTSPRNKKNQSERIKPRSISPTKLDFTQRTIPNVTGKFESILRSSHLIILTSCVACTLLITFISVKSIGSFLDEQQLQVVGPLRFHKESKSLFRKENDRHNASADVLSSHDDIFKGATKRDELEEDSPDEREVEEMKNKNEGNITIDISVENESAVFDWEYGDIVHVVNTRFMQNQANLLHLGQARLEIFKVFCLPTLIAQTTDNFLWIIRTDPDLHPTLKSQLQSLLEPYPHFILLATNDNPEGFRSIKISDPIWSGDSHLVQSYLRAAETRIVLETRLDADDGLMIYFLEYVQYSARRLVVKINNTTPNWMLWCVDTHVEWHFSSHSKSGAMIPQVTDQCVTSGLTWGFNKNAKRNDLFPKTSHSHLHKLINDCSENGETECLNRLQGLNKPAAAIRARTPTSAGMHHMGVSKEEWSIWEKIQDKTWNKLQVTMGLNREKAKILMKYIKSSILEIAKDNLYGQCTKGHSCKDSTKKQLHDIIKREEKKRSKKDEKKAIKRK